MGKESELTPGKSFEKRILTKRIGVFNNAGTIYGIETDCKHMKASLANGKVIDGTITCPWHNWKYDLDTGKCLTVDKVKLKRYDVEISNGNIYLLME